MGIRDLFIAFLGWGCVPLALYNSYYGFLGYVWFSVMKPQTLVWSQSVLNADISLTIMIALLVKLIISSDWKLRFSLPFLWLFLLLVWFFLCTLSSNDFSKSFSDFMFFGKVVFGPFLVAIFIERLSRFKTFVALLAACTGFYGIKIGVFFFRSGTTSGGGPIGLDNNDVALFLAMGIPLLIYVGFELKEKWLKRGYLLATALSCAAVIATSSRGGMLAMGVGLGLTFWLRFKTAKTLLLVPVVAILLFSITPGKVLDRYQTIDNYSEDYSAMGRINSWKTAINIANQNLFGSGFGLDAYLALYPNYQTTDKETPRAAHSAWFQVLGESGYPGLLLFVAMIVSTVKLGLRLRKDRVRGEEYAVIGRHAEMLLTVIVVYLVGASFLSQAKFEFFYYILAAMGSLGLIAKDMDNKKSGRGFG